MKTNIFSPMEIDAIGEIMNISLGSSATAVSNMLDRRVDITTPCVSVETIKDFTLGNIQPAMGVEIKYTSGLEGSNIMLLKKNDIKIIVDILMGSETPEEEFELNELTISAVCEVMNQMMGAASTALSDFLGRLVNISTPESLDLQDFDAFKRSRFQDENGSLVVVRFSLSIENALESEFMNVMPISLARELVAGFGLDTEAETQAQAPQPIQQPVVAEPEAPAAENGGKLSQEEIERLLQSAQAQPAAQAPQAEPAPETTQPQSTPEAPAQPAQPTMPGGMPGMMPGMMPPMMAPDGTMQVPPGYMPPYGQGYMGYPPYYMQPPMPQMADPKVVSAQQLEMPTLEATEKLSQEQAKNLDLIMSVPLEVTVEIGRTRRKVQDILSFAKGSLVVLDKLAGDQVDLFVNGKCIARGDVVVIDDNFGIRVTEILQNPSLEELTNA